jgi:hypothetical protein
MTDELLTPFAEHRLADIEVRPVLGHRLRDQVNVWIWLVGAERQRIAMPIGEFLLETGFCASKECNECWDCMGWPAASRAFSIGDVQSPRLFTNRRGESFTQRS